MRNLFLFVCLLLNCSARSQTKVFEKTISLPYGTLNSFASASRDRGFIVFGSGDTASRFYLTSIDSAGTVKWTKRYKSLGDTPYAEAIHQATDGSFIALGSYFSWYGSSSANEEKQLYIFKVDTTGNVSWVKRTPFQIFDYYTGYSIAELADGSLVVGSYASLPFLGSGSMIMKLDANTGKLLWTKRLNSGFTAQKIVVRTTFDNNIAISVSQMGNSASDDCFLFKTDTSGGILWAKKFGSNNTDMPIDMQQTADSGFVVTGYTITNQGDTVAFLSKADKDGNVTWFRTYTDTFVRVGLSVRQTGDNGFIVSGGFGVWVLGNVVEGSFLLRTDSIGNVTWTKTFPGKSGVVSVEETDDKGFVATGSVKSTINNQNNTFILKIDSNGTGCAPYISTFPDTASIVISQHPVLNTSMTPVSISLGSSTFTIDTGATIVGCSACISPVVAVVTTSGSTSFCKGDSLVLSANQSHTYHWSNADTNQQITVYNTGSYSVTTGDTNGCISFAPPVSVSVFPLPTAPIINVIWDTLISSPAFSYQWYLNGNIISGATSQSFVAIQTGNYTLSVTDTNGCSATSVPYSFSVSLHDTEAPRCLLYPNPTKGVFTLVTNERGRLIITNLQGQQVAVYDVTDGKNLVRLSELPAGVYIAVFKGKVSGNIVKTKLVYQH